MDLIKTIQKHGIKNCMFLVPMKPLRTYFGIISLTSSSDEDVIVPTIVDETKFKLSENYKITLKSINEGFGQEHFYISDLKKMLDQCIVNFYVKPL